jgi:hypothetical protein
MSRITAPLLSFGASGAIAKTQVYSKWKGRPYVRRYVIPANPDTTDQQLTRSVFAWLQNVWKFAASQVTEAYAAYAQGQVMTDRNAFGKINIGVMREQTDIDLFMFSPGAKSGLAAAAAVVTPGSDQLSVAVTAPTLPTGWTIDRAIVTALRSQDPHSGTLYTMFAGEDASSPYTIVLTGLGAHDYNVGAWFKFIKPDGTFAYGPSILTTGTST